LDAFVEKENRQVAKNPESNVKNKDHGRCQKKVAAED
jgi:hypothetical protein